MARLRSGYTTGTCAAAAARAAVDLALDGLCPDTVEIPFPDGSRHRFPVRCSSRLENGLYRASVIKDAGDDPDVTNGVEIAASVFVGETLPSPENPAEEALCPLDREGRMLIGGGPGVGRVTKPGLAVLVGEPAINPGPRQMIAEAVAEGLASRTPAVVKIVISIPRGEELAGRTLNRRLGIVGGLSVLGTSGIVRPVSAEAWTATIAASLDVAREAGLSEVVLSTGRRSEKAVLAVLDVPEEAGAMMGDYLAFSLKAAADRGFTKVHLAGMWAKIMKAALEIPQTHVRNGALEVRDGAALLTGLGLEGQIRDTIAGANTAREIYGHLRAAGRFDLVRAVCRKARSYAAGIAGLPVTVYLVDSSGEVVIHV